MLPPATDTLLEGLAADLEVTNSEPADTGINAGVKAHQRKRSKGRPDPGTELVYFGLEEEKRAELEAIAAERGITFDELVLRGVELYLAKLRCGEGEPLSRNSATGLSADRCERRCKNPVNSPV
jgi:hypothetical protein